MFLWRNWSVGFNPGTWVHWKYKGFWILSVYLRLSWCSVWKNLLCFVFFVFLNTLHLRMSFRAGVCENNNYDCKVYHSYGDKMINESFICVHVASSPWLLFYLLTCLIQIKYPTFSTYKTNSTIWRHKAEEMCYHHLFHNTDIISCIGSIAVCALSSWTSAY